MSLGSALLGPSPAAAEPHPLHAHDRNFRETNCYVDMIVELVHALGCEPTACLAFPLASDFEGDQWTFVKPGTADLDLLYGVRIEELCLWRPLASHVEEQLRLGRIPLVEVDAWFLPDVQGSDYHTKHAKTSIAITHLDLGAQRMRYFHNAGCFEVGAQDLAGVLGLGEHAPLLPPYCELVKLDRCTRHTPAELRARSLELARRYHERRPRRNPLAAWAARWNEHLGWIRSGGFEAYHAYSFAAVRQLGAAFELLSTYATWLDAGANGPFAAAAREALAICAGAKTWILKLARVANSGKPYDAGETLGTLARAWDACQGHFGDALA